jgi:hypothetical protein
MFITQEKKKSETAIYTEIHDKFKSQTLKQLNVIREASLLEKPF